MGWDRHRTVIGASALDSVNDMLQNFGKLKGTERYAKNRFRFRNGQEEVSEQVARISVAMKGIKGVIDAAVIAGQALLLLGRPMLEKLIVRMDFDNMSPRLLKPAVETKMISNDSGQLLVNLLEFHYSVAHGP